MAARERRGLFGLFGKKKAPSDDLGKFELVVIEGADEGACYPLEAPEVQLGRGRAKSRRPDQIFLSDRSVSVEHAVIKFADGKITLGHLKSATNPTLVNGRPIKSKQIEVGDKFVLGVVVLQLRELGSSPEPAAPRASPTDATVMASAGPVAKPAPSVPKPTSAGRAELVLQSGLSDWNGRCFEIGTGTTSIGRAETCDISLPVGAISRQHLSLQWEDGQLVLIHESGVNPTSINGTQVLDRQVLSNDDEVLLAEQVCFKVRIEAVIEPAATVLFDAVGDGEATRIFNPEEENAAASPEGDRTVLYTPDASPAEESPPASPEGDRTVLYTPDASPAEESPSAAPEGDRTVLYTPDASPAEENPPAAPEGDRTVLYTPDASPAEESPPAAPEGDRTVLYTPDASPAEESPSPAPEGDRTVLYTPDAPLAEESAPAAPEGDRTVLYTPDPTPAAGSEEESESDPGPELAEVEAVLPPDPGAEEGSAALADPSTAGEPAFDPGATRMIDTGHVSNAAAKPTRTWARLVLNAGVEGWQGRRFELDQRRTGIGRHEECEISLPLEAVSRRHAAVIWEDDQLVLICETDVSPTHVNGVEVEYRQILAHGDEIKLANLVRFYVMIGLPTSNPGANPQAEQNSKDEDEKS